MPRMNILSWAEQNAFDVPPVFNSAERKQFLDFSPTLLETALRLKNQPVASIFCCPAAILKHQKDFSDHKTIINVILNM